MSDFEEKILERMRSLEREVERLRVGDKVSKALLDTYYLGLTAKAADSDKLDGIDSTGFVNTTGTQTIGGAKTFSTLPTLPTATPTTNQAVRKGYADGAYLGISAKAADSDKLDGVDSTGFVNTTDTQTINGAKTFGTLPTLPTTTPTANQAVRKGYADATYLGKTAKAADADKLDGYDSTAFLRDNGWKSYTPTWTAATTNPSIGNGTLSGRYIQIGKLVYCQFTMVAGSTTTFGSGVWRFSYPISPNTSYIYLQVGSSLLADAGTRYYDGVTKYGGATFMTIIVGTGEIYATHPFTWATNDSLTVNIIYEAA